MVTQYKIVSEQDVIDVIKAYSDVMSIAPATASGRLTQDARLFITLADGGSITTRRIRNIFNRARESWPDGFSMPDVLTYG